MVSPKNAAPTLEKDGFRFLYFSDLLNRRVSVTGVKRKLGRLSDIVFQLKEPYPEAVGLFLEFGWGRPTQFIPWDRIERIEKRRIVVKAPDEGDVYPPFVDQPGWMLVDAHLIGRTILDLDGRRTEVVNDAHFLEAKGHLVLIHVDTSLNGILRRWLFKGLRWIKEDFINWRYVQPLNVEDAVKTDRLSLSVTRNQLKELPPEDLADALESIGGEEQEALFSALDTETAAEVLVEAEPRAQRQIIEDLEPDRARDVFSEMTIPQVASVLSVLPHDDKEDILDVLEPEVSRRVEGILAARDAKAVDLVTSEYVNFGPSATVGEVLAGLRTSARPPAAISYVYVVAPEDNVLLGVVDLRELVLATDERPLAELMTSPMVTAEAGDLRDSLIGLFGKYHFRSIPVIDEKHHILGVIRYQDIMTNVEVRPRD